MFFGPDRTRGVVSQNRKSVLIRSHQVPSTNRGCKELQRGLCLTVFSASNYCGVTHDGDGVAVFTGPGDFAFKEHMAPPLSVLLPALRDGGQPPIAAVTVALTDSGMKHLEASMPQS